MSLQVEEQVFCFVDQCMKQYSYGLFIGCEALDLNPLNLILSTLLAGGSQLFIIHLAIGRKYHVRESC